MAGETWGQRWQAGVESAYGTDAAATRVMYFRQQDSALDAARESRPKIIGTGTRDNVRGFRNGPEMAGARVSQDVSPYEILELLQCGIRGGVTPTTPGGGTASRLWTFTPGNAALDSMTLENNDGAIARQMTGAVVDRLTIAGSANGENIVTADLIGKSISAAALTGSLAERDGKWLDGWQTEFFLDAFGATPGTTEQDDALVNWSVTINNNIGRLYRASNRNAIARLSTGLIGVEATLTIDATHAAAAAEWANWIAATKKVARLKFTGETPIEGALYPYVAIDLPGAWSAFRLGQEDGDSRVYELSMTYVYDAANGYGLRVLAQNDRTAAWGA